MVFLKLQRVGFPSVIALMISIIQADVEGAEFEKHVLYVNVQLKSYRDMIEVYDFDKKEVKILEEMMAVFRKGNEGG